MVGLCACMGKYKNRDCKRTRFVNLAFDLMDKKNEAEGESGWVLKNANEPSGKKMRQCHHSTTSALTK